MIALNKVFYHWGSIVVPVGYTEPSVFGAGGNPYGVSFSDPRGEPMPDAILEAARYQGRRVARFAEFLRAGREARQPA